MSTRFEVVRTDAPQPWHARFIAANGRILFSSENYVHKAGAENAIAVLARSMDARLTRVGVRTITDKVSPVEVRYIDERAAHRG